MSFLRQALPQGRPPRRYTEPHIVQLAALCWRKGKKGREVLLVTSSSGRWILPKGWPITGKSAAETALTEAWEEGGVIRGDATSKPVGSYMAIKRTQAGDDVPCLHEVIAVKVRESADEFPESHRRDRIWVSPAQAAEMVDEDGLKDVLLKF